MGARRNVARDGIVGVNRQHFGALHRGRGWIAMSEHEASHAVSQRRLADALRTADQPGMRNAPTPIGAQERGFRLAMSEQRRGLARMRHGDLRFDLARAHAEVATLAAGTAKKRSRRAVQTWAATVSGLASASTSTQRSGSAAAISR